jgi:hypothetical protein
VQRSPDLVKLFITDDKLFPEELELIWNATNLGEAIKNEIYKVIKEISSPMKYDQTEFIVDKIDKIPDSKVVAEELDVLFVMGKFTKGTARYSIKICELLWKIATSE